MAEVKLRKIVKMYDDVEAVRLLVGSANLTPGGYRLNREVALPITATAKQPEAEIAGHLAHRVLKHGAELVNIEITADDRSRWYRRPAFTSAVINNHCVITASGHSMAALY